MKASFEALLRHAMDLHPRRPGAVDHEGIAPIFKRKPGDWVRTPLVFSGNAGDVLLQCFAEEFAKEQERSNDPR